METVLLRLHSLISAHQVLFFQNFNKILQRKNCFYFYWQRRSSMFSRSYFAEQCFQRILIGGQQQRASLVSQRVESACNTTDAGSVPGWGRSPGGGHGHPLQCCWKIPWEEGPGGLLSTGSQRVVHWVTRTLFFFSTLNNNNKGKKERFQDPKTENISGRVLLSEIHKHTENLKDREEKARSSLVEVDSALSENYGVGFG